jgi:hypothetical protein
LTPFIFLDSIRDMITARVDVVGSLLRPAELLKAQKDLASSTITQATFKTIEDRAVDEAVMLQEQAGLEVITDGEMRRQSFQSQMTEAVNGFGEYTLDAFLWGKWQGEKEVGDWTMERPSTLGVVKKLIRKRYLSVTEYMYLSGRTTRTDNGEAVHFRRGQEANSKTLPVSNGIYVSIGSDNADTQGHVAKPQPVCELLVTRALEERLSNAR